MGWWRIVRRLVEGPAWLRDGCRKVWWSGIGLINGLVEARGW